MKVFVVFWFLVFFCFGLFGIAFSCFWFQRVLVVWLLGFEASKFPIKDAILNFRIEFFACLSGPRVPEGPKEQKKSHSSSLIPKSSYSGDTAKPETTNKPADNNTNFKSIGP